MRLAVISDLHLDSWCRDLEEVNHTINLLLDRCRESNPDFIVIAGDIFNGHEYFGSPIKEDPSLIYVPGNHDYYGCDFPYQDEKTNQKIDLKGIRGLKGTMWTDFNEDYGSAPFIFRQISDSERILYANVNLLSTAMGNFTCDIDEIRPEVVISHFAPTHLSIGEKYATSMLNPYFCNNLARDIQEKWPFIKLWICGHVHHRHMYVVGNCLVVCNPMGYSGENYNSIDDYNPLIIDYNFDLSRWEISYDQFY